MRAVVSDLDYLAARLHGRRSRLAEAERLDELCRLRSIPELASALYPEREFQTTVDLQRQLVQDLAGEMSELVAHLTGGGARLLDWMVARFQVENLKILVRGLATRTPLDLLQSHLVSLPKELGLNVRALATAGSLDEFIRLLPVGPLRESLEEAAGSYGGQTKPFFLEAALDRGYFRELLARVDRLAGEDKEVIQAMVFQEVDIFHLMLVTRGRFHYGLPPALLLPLHLDGTRISRARFTAMLGEPDLRAAAHRAVGHALDSLPPEPKGMSEAPSVVDPAMLEALAWKRFLHLANSAFRRSHIGLGTVVGYVGIRRAEVANLITLSEGIRTGLPVEVIRARLIPRSDLEAAYV
jgi:vacuolar-type H+-ATPase subunit C/Vma6